MTLINKKVFVNISICSIVIFMLFGAGTTALFGQEVITNRLAQIGQVQNVSGNTIVLTQKSGDVIQVIISGATKILNSDNKPLASGQIRVGNIVAAITNVVSASPVAVSSSSSSRPLQSGTSKIATKIYVKEASSSATTRQQVVAGIITGINNAVITILKKGQQEEYFNLEATSGAVVRKAGNQIATIDDLKLGQTVVAIAQSKQQGNLSAKLFHILGANP